MDDVLFILAIFFLLFLTYWVIRKIIDSDFRKNIISGELKSESSKMTIKISDWFVWNVQVNNEKGTAGGNIKINFPIKSSIVMALACIICSFAFGSLPGGTIVSIVFFSFAIYHFRKWYIALKVVNAYKAIENISHFTRSYERKYIAGVCAGINKNYGISLMGTRMAFIGLSFFAGIGMVIYIIIWVFTPPIFPTR